MDKNNEIIGDLKNALKYAFPDKKMTKKVGLVLSGGNIDTRLIASVITRELARAEYTIADDYLSGRADRETTIQRLMKYGLHSRGSAERRIRFIDTYRSYIINYGLGRDMVQAWVEAQGPDHWTTMERLLGSQILPTDLL